MADRDSNPSRKSFTPTPSVRTSLQRNKSSECAAVAKETVPNYPKVATASIQVIPIRDSIKQPPVIPPRRRVPDFIKRIQSDTYHATYHSEHTGRLAEKMRDNSKLVKNGNPSVYYLQSNQRSSTLQPLRWFDVGSPNSTVSHKKILLVGATGFGKSTLINAMVNYILGVQWDDPFRFKIVVDEARASQAKSQTSTITAYTVHHTTGFNVPFSLTIIDTPGFGDTGGLEKDEEISRMIGNFLIHPESQMDDINAVCFVASSADARMTPTQKYVLESILSIFGKDIKHHIRLLTTFSDGLTPLVVETFRQAGFPLVQDNRGEIIYNKFNNSVLFAVNVGGNSVKIDQIFWNMGAKNFESFFSMLERMPIKSLANTKQVILHRTELAEGLEWIEQEVKLSLETIESIESERRRFEKHLQNLQSIPSADLKMKIHLENDVWAYSCIRCLIACYGECHQVWQNDNARMCETCLRSCKHHSQPSYCENATDEERAAFKNACQSSIQEAINSGTRKLVDTKNRMLQMLAAFSEDGQKLKLMALVPGVTTPEQLVAQLTNRLERDRPSGYRDTIQILNELIAMWKEETLFRYSI